MARSAVVYSVGNAAKHSDPQVRFDLLNQSTRFEPLGVLGEGAGGTVYKVRHRDSGELLALKLLHGQGENAAEQLKRELETVAGIEHPNLVRMGDCGQLGEFAYYTMELVEGTSLLRYVRRPSTDAAGADWPFDEARLRSTLSQLVCGLSALHAAFRVHRDVKPSNVCVTYQGRTVLLDMGIVAGVADLESPELGVGTPQYMSPEQAAGEQVGPPADLYAVGVVLYEALTGELPHPEAAKGDILAKLQRDPAPPRTLRADLPADLDALCCALLARDPDDRPVARQVLRELGSSVANDVTAPGATRLRAPDLLLGREEARDELLGHLRAARQSGEWTHVTGPAGRGKSTLFRHLLGEVQQDAPDVLIARGYCSIAPFAAYEGLRGLVEPLAQGFDGLPERALSDLSLTDSPWLRGLFPSLNGCEMLLRTESENPVPDPRERRRRALVLLRDLVREVAALRGVVLCIEDIHRAGPETLTVVEALTRPPRPPGLWVLTSSEQEPPVGFDRRDLRLVQLPPLSTAAGAGLSHALMEQSGFDSEDHPVGPDECGEPWQILERTRAVLQGLSASDFDSPIRARIEACSGDARSILAALAVAGRPVLFEETRFVTALPNAEFAEELAKLCQAGLVLRSRDGGVLLELEHELTRANVLEALPDGDARDFHERWALAAQAARKSESYARFRHCLAAENPQEAAEHALTAAREARDCYAFERAAELRSEAARLCPPDTTKEGQKLARELAESMELAGRCGDAGEAYSAAANNAPSAEKLHLLSKAAVMTYSAGDISAGTATARRVLDLVGLSLPDTIGQAMRSIAWNKICAGFRGGRYKARSTHQITPNELAQTDTLWSMGNLFAQSDVMRAFELWTRAHQYALKAGEPSRVGRALLREVLSDASLEKPPHTRSRKRLQQAAELLQEVQDPYLQGYLVFAQGYLDFFGFKLAQAVEAFERAETIFRDHCSDVAWELTNIHMMILQCRTMTLPIDRLAIAARAYSQEARQRGDALALASIVTQGLAYVHIVEDDPEGGMRAVDAVMQNVPDDTIHIQHLHAFNARTILLQYSDASDVAERTEQWMRPLRESFMGRVQIVRVTLTMQFLQATTAAAARNSGERREQYIKRATADARFLRRQNTPLYQAISEVTQARLAGLASDREAALTHLMASSELFERLGMNHLGSDYAIARLRGEAGAAGDIEAQIAAQGVRNVARYLDQTGAGCFDGLYRGQ